MRQRVTPWITVSSHITPASVPQTSAPQLGPPQGSLSSVAIIPQTSGLVLLPCEVELEITRYLSASSKLSLSHTCRRFRTTTDTYIGDLFPASKSVSTVVILRERQKALECFAFLCMLERDGTMSSAKLPCSECCQVHHCSVFTRTAIAQESSKRKCIGCEGKIWICPHRDWSCSRINSLMFPPRLNLYMLYDCRCPGDTVFSPRKLEVSTTFPLLKVITGKTSLIADCVAKCKVAQIQFCPHLRSSDEAILDSLYTEFSRLSAKLDQLIHSQACSSEKAYSGLQCQTCKTRVSFGVFDCRGSQKLKVVATRELAQSSELVLRPTDPEWIKHLAMPEDFASLTEDWENHALRELIPRQSSRWTLSRNLPVPGAILANVGSDLL